MAYKIAVIPGDGTGPEVVNEGLKVLKAVAGKENIKCDWFYDLGGERYLKTGEVLPDSVLEELKKLHAIFLGAIGHPQVKPGILEQGILLVSVFPGSIHQFTAGEALSRSIYSPQRQRTGAYRLCHRS